MSAVKAEAGLYIVRPSCKRGLLSTIALIAAASNVPKSQAFPPDGDGGLGVFPPEPSIKPSFGNSNEPKAYLSIIDASSAVISISAETSAAFSLNLSNKVSLLSVY